jgi:hypothetical protein
MNNSKDFEKLILEIEKNKNNEIKILKINKIIFFISIIIFIFSLIFSFTKKTKDSLIDNKNYNFYRSVY